MKVQIIDDDIFTQEPVMMEWTIREEEGSDLPTFQNIFEAIENVLNEFNCVEKRWWPGQDVGLGIEDRR